MTDSVEVLIVGAGPVGLLTAVALAQSGVDVMVVEAEAKLNDSPRAANAVVVTIIAGDRRLSATLTKSFASWSLRLGITNGAGASPRASSALHKASMGAVSAASTAER